MEIANEVRYMEVPDFPGYRVGDDGSVWSCRKSKGNKPSIIGSQWRQLNPSRDRNGYFFLRICRDQKAFSRYVAHLVLLAFVGPRPSQDMEAAHENGNPNDNRLSNLKWKTRLENAADKRRHGTLNIGERNGSAKLRANQVAEIRLRYAKGGITKCELARAFGVSDGLICMIIHRRIWRHVD